MYDKWGSFDIVIIIIIIVIIIIIIFVLNGDVPRATCMSCSVFISHLTGFARASSQVSDFNKSSRKHVYIILTSLNPTFI